MLDADRSSLAVLDTSVVSVLIRGRELADAYRALLADRRAAISFQTLEELWFWAYSSRWGEPRRIRLAAHLEQYEVVWPDRTLVDISARLRDERKGAGRTLNTADAWIAATAIRLSCPLATHDRDFSSIDGLEVIQAP